MFTRARFDELFELGGRVAIITGGSRGIGRSIAEAFAALGASVVVSSRKADVCEATASEIRDAGGSALARAAHVGSLDDVAGLVIDTVDALGRVDIIVNNAANPLMLGVGALTEDAWASSFNTNLRGPVFLVQEALPHLEASGHGAVLNVLSNSAYLSSGGHILYAAAKAGLAAATRSMAADLAPKGIRVNALVPGTVDTAMVRSMPEDFQERAARASLLQRAAHPDELAPLAVLLASDAGSFMTGQTYVCDGGQHPR